MYGLLTSIVQLVDIRSGAHRADIAGRGGGGL